MKNLALFSIIWICIFLWHCPFKGLCTSFKKLPLTPLSMILGGVKLCAVSYCMESILKNSITRRNLYKNRKYFNPLLSGQSRLELGKKLVNLPCLSVPLKTIRKIRISWQKRNQKWNYFIPLVSGPGRFEWWKKTGGRKSCWTVPLIMER